MSNVDKMRDALEHCRDYFYDLLQGVFLERQMAEQTSNPNMDDKKDESKLLQKIEEALAAPPRNCDVGTVKGQTLRFHEFCLQYQEPFGLCPEDCPLFVGHPDAGYCQSEWMQMPYKPEEDNK